MDGIENAGNKFRTSFLMEVHNIPHPKTVIAEDVNKALIAAEKFDDLVLKPLFGNQGKGVITSYSIHYTKLYEYNGLWIVGKECADKLKEQDKKIKILKEVKGSELVGLKIKNLV